MRIHGFSSGFGSGTGSGSQERRRRFRSSHSVGQLVRGELLRHENEQLSWVLVDGQELLAAVGNNSGPGTLLSFRIIQLVPDIVLKQVDEGGGPGLTLDDLAQDYGRSWEGLSALAANLDYSTARSVDDRAALFQSRLAQDQELAAAYLAHGHFLGLINAELAARGAGMLASMPWLLPQARDQEIFFHQQPGSRKSSGASDDGLLDVTYSFSLDRLGFVRARILVRQDLARFRLFMERPEKGDMLAALIHDLEQDLAAEKSLVLECLGVSPLSPGPRSMLAAYLSSPERRAFTGLNRRV